MKQLDIIKIDLKIHKIITADKFKKDGQHWRAVRHILTQISFNKYPLKAEILEKIVHFTKNN